MTQLPELFIVLPVQVEYGPNDLSRAYHTICQLSKGPDYVDKTTDLEDPDLALTHAGKTLARILLALGLPGLEHLFFRYHAVETHKGQLFLWEDIEPGVFSSLKQLLGAHQLIIKYDEEPDETETEGLTEDAAT